MNCPKLLCLISLAAVITSCQRFAYFQSPFHNNSASYKTIPTARDSAASVIYASGVITTGGANDRLRDGVTGFIGTVYRAHTGRYLQGYYGVTTGLGGYNLRKENASQNYDNHYFNDSLINAKSGAKFFGGVGAMGGINFVLPFRGMEWRIIGLEASWLHEFGHYLRFRKQLPEDAANLIARRTNYLCLGLHTDLVFYTRDGSAGFKTGAGWINHNQVAYDQDGNRSSGMPGFFTQTIHVTKYRSTCFFQYNIGYHAAGVQLGFNHRF